MRLEIVAFLSWFRFTPVVFVTSRVEELPLFSILLAFLDTVEPVLLLVALSVLTSEFAPVTRELLIPLAAVPLLVV